MKYPIPVLISIALLLFGRAGVLAQQPKLMLPSAHLDAINDVQFSEDDRLMATISMDATIKIWNTGNGKLLHNLTGHTSGVKKVFFLHEGQRVISVAEDNVIKLWDVSNGTFLKDLAKMPDGIYDAFLTRDGKKLMVVTYNVVHIINPDNGAILFSMKDERLGATGFAAISPDEQTIALVKQLSGDEGHINILNITDRVHQSIVLDYCPWGARQAGFYNDSLLISHCGNRALSVINVKTGEKKVHETIHDAAIRNLQVYPERSLVMTQSDSNVIRISGLETVEEARPWSVFRAVKQQIKLNASQNTFYICTGGDDEDYDSLFTLTANGTGEVSDKKYFPVKGRFTSVYFGHSKRVVAVTRRSGELEVMNSNTGQVLFKSFSSLQQVNALFNQKDSIIYTGDGFGLLKKWEVHAGKLSVASRVASSWIEAIDYNDKNSRVAIGTGDGSIKIAEATTLEVQKEFHLPNHMVIAVVFSHDGSKIAGSFRKTDDFGEVVQVWDIASGKKLFSKQGYFYKGHSPFLPNDRQIFFSNSGDHSLDVFDIASGSLLRKLKGHTASIASVAPNFNSSMIVTASNDKTVKVWELASGKMVFEIRNNESEFNGAVLSPDGKLVAAMAYNGELQVWDFLTKKRLYHTSVEYGPSRLKFVDKGKLAIEAAGTVYLLSVSGFQLRELGKGDWLQAWDHNAHYTHLRNLTLVGAATSFSLVPIDGSNSGTEFYGIDSSDYLSKIPSGYYRSSAKASKSLHYVLPGLKIVSFEQLDAKYNRPDRVLQAIGAKDTLLIHAYLKAYHKRVQKLGIDTSSFKDGFGLPEADIANRESISLVQDSGRLLLQIKGSDSSFILDRFNVWVNETPLFGMNGIPVRDRQTNNIDTTITITLAPGENMIETSLTNVNGIESYRMPLFVQYHPKQPLQEKLYFIGIGINRFADSSQNLRWSVKDIRDLANGLKNKYGSDIVIDTLFDREVTPSNIAALKNKLLQTTVSDKVLLAYSGHGLLSKEFDYYLSMYDVHFSQPENGGLPYEDLERLLDSIPARKKLMFIDACHSGEVDKAEMQKIEKVNAGSISEGAKGATPILLNAKKTGMKNSFELMQELFVNVARSTGATVISAAAGTQFALERGDLKNGVFTYSILEYMKKHPTATVTELKQYVNRRVPELTRGVQVPTTRTETKTVDWKVW